MRQQANDPHVTMGSFHALFDAIQWERSMRKDLEARIDKMEEIISLLVRSDRNLTEIARRQADKIIDLECKGV